MQNAIGFNPRAQKMTHFCRFLFFCVISRCKTSGLKRLAAFGGTDYLLVGAVFSNGC